MMPNAKEIRLAITAPTTDDAKRLTHVTHSLGFSNSDVFQTPRLAYEVASRKQYEIFITYQDFEDMTGLTMIQSLRATGNYGLESHLFLVNRLDPELMVILSELNIKYVVQKPFNSDHISQKMQSLWQDECNLSQAEQLYREAHSAFQSGLYEMSLDLAVKLIKEHKPAEKHLLLLGDVFLKLDRHAEAQKSYQRARELFPQSYVPAHKIVKLLMKEKKFAEAAPLLDELTRLSPLNLEILANTGLSNFEIGEYERSKSAMARLKALDKERKDANEILARIAIREGDYRGSLKLLSQHDSARLCEVLHAEVETLRQQQAYVRIIDLYLKFIEMLENHPMLYELYYKLGIAYLEIYDEIKARTYFQKSLSLESSYQPAVLALTKLKAG